MVRCLMIAALTSLFLSVFNAARAQPELPPAAAQTPAQPAAPALAQLFGATLALDAPAAPASAPAATPVPSPEGEAAVGGPPAAPGEAPPKWGAAFRARWITVPHWFLGMFTKVNQSLSSYGVGLEGFRRKRDADDPNRYSEMSLGLGYQNMSPPDGNWLGKGHAAAADTDWVQFKNFGFWTIDFAYLGRQYFNEVFGIHYGAGLGLAIIQGDMLRTSSAGCTEQNINTPACRPQVCTGGVCTEAELANSSKTNQVDTPTTPSRFRESAVPGAFPIVNLVLGVDFRIPTAPGLEFRLEGGFFDALFLGGAVAYVY